MINYSRNVQPDWLYDQHYKVNDHTKYQCITVTLLPIFIILLHDTNVQDP